MRVSSHQYHQNIIRSINQGTTDYNRLSVQLATNQRIAKPSDDPLGSVMLLTLDGELSSIKQYQSNMNDVEYTLGQQETQLTGAVNILNSMQELTTTAADGSMGETEIAALGQQMNVLFPAIVDLLNAKDGDGRYYFSGSLTDVQPFQQDAAGQYQYLGDSNIREVSVSADSNVSSNVVGSDIDPGATFLNQMQTYLNLLTTDPANPSVGDESRTMMDGISSFLQRVTDQLTKVGAIRDSLESIKQGNDDIAVYTQGLRDDISQVDYAETYVKMNESVASYESTLKVYNRVSQLSLFSMI
ncbi:flagellar hook-associated protein FlgL [Shewanella sp. A32]|uniref:flagellar hook-associated protein FlgL n=1 Tax=Shewanella sp. A32 TaxID=3031327 RepID=UPI0023B9E515|nr:flagellar hook-associated protein FlgL [Shewanella sp. A32]MDF0535733.1 flagellar hook-associated protein FlgL [Shewanella sp. A32]